MTLSRLKEGDLVKVNKKGRVFYAEIEGLDRGEIQIRPLDSRVSYRTATAREVVDAWRKLKS